MASRKKYNMIDDDGSQPFGLNHLIFYFWSLAHGSPFSMQIDM